MKEKSVRGQWRLSRRDVVMSSILGILFIGQVASCVLFYNSAGLNVLLYLGLVILVVTSLIGWGARVAFQRRGGAQEGESWLQTTAVVDSGIYAIVRHPMYLSFILYIISLILISQYWLSSVLAVPMIALLYFFMLEEEQSSIQKFGNQYERYMQKVPRLNLLEGVMRALRRRKSD